MREIAWSGSGQWVKADTHIHTRFSDGEHSVAEVAAQARRFGCDVIAITDHADRTLSAATPEYAEAIEVARRQFPGLIILAGVEWNVPPGGGDDHATLLMPSGSGEFMTLAEFKRRFDDLDRPDEPTPSVVEALTWLAKFSLSDSVQPVLIFNHPSRKAANSRDLAERMRALRQVNDLFIGFSGAPGHQAGAALGSYEGAIQTVDRWDPAAGIVGDAWDELLQQGIDVWAARAPSDFHGGPNDYWPGQFSETWLYVPERTPDGVLRAFRAGSFFAAHGHIAREAQLTVAANGLPRPAYAGETIEVAGGATLAVRLSANVPSRDWQDKPNQIDLAEFILTTSDGSQRISVPVSGKSPKRLEAVAELVAPQGGMVVRARGRRVVDGGDDLLFYTNPVRILVTQAARESASANDSRRNSARWIGGVALLATACLALALRIGRALVRPTRDAGHVAAPRLRELSPAVLPPSNTPNPPRRMHFAAAALVFTLLAVYGSLVPLNFQPLSLAEGIERYSNTPWLKLSIAHRADWVANILLFVPISFLWMAALATDRRNRLVIAVCGAGVVVLSCVLSVALEFSQIWFPPRTVSQNDIAAECLGGLLGVGLWILLGRGATRWMRQRNQAREPASRLDWLLQAYLLGLGIYSLLPLDLTIHPNELWHKLRTDRVVLVPFAGFEPTWTELWNRITDVLVFVPVGVFAARAWRPAGAALRGALEAILLGTSFAALIEFCQLFVYSRSSDTADIILGGLGVAAGVWLAHRFTVGTAVVMVSAERTTRPSALWCWGLGAVFSAVLCLIFWMPLDFQGDAAAVRERMHGFFRVPFAAMYWGTEYNAATEILRKTILFGILGCLLAAPIVGARIAKRQKRWLLAGVVAYSVILGTGIELVQSALPPHIPDVTDVILHALGTLLGILVAARLFGRRP